MNLVLLLTFCYEWVFWTSLGLRWRSLCHCLLLGMLKIRLFGEVFGFGGPLDLNEGGLRFSLNGRVLICLLRRVLFLVRGRCIRRRGLSRVGILAELRCILFCVVGIFGTMWVSSLKSGVEERECAYSNRCSSSRIFRRI